MALSSLFMCASFLTAVFAPLTAATPLASIQKRDVSRNGEPGLLGAGETYYPRVTKLKDGSLLSCRTSMEGSNSVLRTARSTNGGWDWTDVGSIASGPRATGDLDNCFLHQLPSGRILAAFRNHDVSNSQWTYYRLIVSYSDNNGNDWSFLSMPRESGTRGLGIWEPFMMDAQDGSLMFYYSRETNTAGTDQDSILIRSYDSGKSWTGDQTISGGGITSRDGMLGVVRTGGSNLIAVFETMAPDIGIHSVTSSDDGATWGNRRLVYRSSVSGATHGAPQVALVGSKLVTSFQTNEDNVGASSFAIKVVTSTNGGASWGEKTTVLNSCEWAGMATVDNGHVVVVCSLNVQPVSSRYSLSQIMNVS
ncbi:unnamed protein product [Clonostachys chloroleuca]|uniref:Sialidase domain-containing protein n=1 Tax=Clonostachys chloroleuca TaxID=1926264 RepID=A0AA35M0V3_9HYPO|nr:unnamed protein product [Clonostachys chloroleuca]